MDGVDVDTVIAVLRQYYLPDALDQVFQEVAKFLNYKRTDQLMERFLLEFQILHTKAERRIQSGFQSPDAFVSVLCMHNASLSTSQKYLIMASVQGSLDFGLVSKQMRQISHPRGIVKKEDILQVTTEGDGSDEKDLSYEAWVAYRKAGKGRKDRPQGSRPKPKGKGGKAEEPTRNGINRKTGERNRRYGCGSEFHLLPKCPRRNNVVPARPSPGPTQNAAPRSSFSSIAMDSDSPGGKESPPTGFVT